MIIQVLVGMIASGKTTYCKNACNQNNIVCINDDSIVNSLHADNYDRYRNYLKPLYKSIENHILTSASMLNLDVIIDRGLNISIEGRRRYIAIAKSLDCPIEAIIIPPESAGIHANRRFSKDSRGQSLEFWLEAARRHEQDWIYPTLEEGFDKLHSITFEEIKSGKII